MSDKSYVFVVENDVFYKMSFPSSLPIANRWIAGLNSEPQFVECSLYLDVCVGATWYNDNFYLPEDTEKLKHKAQKSWVQSQKYWEDKDLVKEIVKQRLH